MPHWRSEREPFDVPHWRSEREPFDVTDDEYNVLGMSSKYHWEGLKGKISHSGLKEVLRILVKSH